MNRQFYDILERQEREESVIYRTRSLWLAMIHRDFADSARLLEAVRISDAEACGAQNFRSFERPAFPAHIFKKPPVRTGDVFSVHKHTRCQIPYFHTHDFCELIYVLKGSCTQEFENVCGPPVLQKGQACLLRPGIIHCMSRCKKDDMILKFTIPEALFEKAAGNIFLDMPVQEWSDGIRAFSSGTPETEFLISMLLEESCRRQAFWERAVENYLSLLFVELVRGPVFSSSAVQNALSAYVAQNGASATLDGFASFIGYSKAYAARLVRRQTGQSFVEAVVALKMERARELLLESDAPVALIADELGYANASGLHKQFLALYGMTPGAYRRLLKQ